MTQRKEVKGVAACVLMTVTDACGGVKCCVYGVVHDIGGGDLVV